MIKKQQEPHDRGAILRALAGFTQGKVTPPEGDGPPKPYVPPSRKNRKSFTTWIDEAALKELRDLSHETGRKQQDLIADALNMLFVRHGKRRVAR
jgi:hypothetical protein